MPFATHFSHPELNIGYLYTNYKRNKVLAEYAKSKKENHPAINGSYRKKNVKPLKLESVFMTRADYNDLGDAFQITFQKVADTSLFIHLSLRFDLFDQSFYSRVTNNGSIR